MHSYQHNIKTFNNATRHLTRVERSLYRDLIELYYDTEQPLPADDFDRLSRRVIALTEDERKALQFVLDEFFEVVGGFYTHQYCDEVIESYRSNQSDKSRAGKASAAARKARAEERKRERLTGVKQVLNSVETEGQQNPTKPETRNQKPETKKKDVPKYSERDFKAAGYFLETILTDQPDFKSPNLDKWADDIRLMRERDNRTYDDIHKVWKWARNNSFWKKNILSPAKFRDKFDQLKANMLEKPNGKQYLDPDDTTWAFGPNASGSSDGEYDLPPIEGDFSRLDSGDQGH